MTQRPFKIIAIETSAQIGSVALAKNAQLIEENAFTENNRYASELLTLLERLCRTHRLKPADIDRIYVSQGPGSYTGLRVGITAAKTLAFAHPIRLIAVPTSDVLALNVENTSCLDENRDCAHIAVISDAGRDRIYVSLYRKSPDAAPSGDPGSASTPKLAPNPPGCSGKNPVPDLHLLARPAVMTPREFLEKSPRPVAVLGQPLQHYRRHLTAAGVIHLPQSLWLPQARNLLRCGWLRERHRLFIQPDRLTPIYPRRPPPEEKLETSC